MRTAAELTLGREPDAVPKARRFVRSSLAGEPPETLHATELVVTELVTNALLHGEPPVSVRLIDLGYGIRVEVEDAGPDLPMQGLQDAGSMTGRGLSVVAGLSSAWGIDPGRRRGKVVWSELPTGGGGGLFGTAADGAGPPRPPEIAPEAVVASQVDRHDEPTYTVRLTAVPTGLLLAAKAHIDNVVRELVLMEAAERSRGSSLPAPMAALVESVTTGFGVARAEIKRQAVAAAGRGESMTDLVLRLPLSYADAGERYLAALDEADRYARSARLLTMAPPLSHRTFRQWYVGAVVDQLRSLAAGREPEPPEPPEPLAAVLAAQLDEVDEAPRRKTG